MTTTQINYWTLQETKRHNLVTEGQSDTSIAETGRHNRVTEQETNRHNLVTEGETNRHNLVTEDISKASLDESIRHNIVTEGETHRHNTAQESNDRIKAQAAASQAATAARRADADIALTNEKTKYYRAEILGKLGEWGKYAGLIDVGATYADESLIPYFKSWYNSGMPATYTVNGHSHDMSSLKQLGRDIARGLESMTITQ